MKEWKDSGYNLKFYADEHKEFSEAFGKKLNSDEARIVVDKLSRHFKIGSLSLHFTDRIGGGKCFYGGLIKLRWNSSAGMICHELAHLLCYRKYAIRGHNRKMWKVMKRLMNYCKTQNYWQDEIARRLAPKPMKSLPTADEIKFMKIDKRKADLARYEKKLKYWTKVYTNKIRKARRSIVMLERSKLGLRMETCSPTVPL